MTNISAAQVKALRDRTNVAMMACKKALMEADGDEEKAVEILRKRGEAKAGEKSTRETAEGLVAISGRAIVKVLCETDFVAKNEKFVAFVNEIVEKADKDGAEVAKEFFESVKTDKIQAIGENIALEDVIVITEGSVVGGYIHSNGKLGTIVALDGGDDEKARDVAMHATAMDPICANPEEVPAELIEKEKEIALVQLKNEGKPEQIIDKIIEGKVKKFCAERALTSQAFVKDPSQSVAEYLGEAKLVKFVRVTV
ncbi:MAG: translation elongation factor Ts [Candidatus Peregrinibacteria bacterium]|nr:translation elongation factor Ts [Candidatus Peregrinibacteria bacterium]